MFAYVYLLAVDPTQLQGFAKSDRNVHSDGIHHYRNPT